MKRKLFLRATAGLMSVIMGTSMALSGVGGQVLTAEAAGIPVGSGSLADKVVGGYSWDGGSATNASLLTNLPTIANKDKNRFTTANYDANNGAFDTSNWGTSFMWDLQDNVTNPYSYSAYAIPLAFRAGIDGGDKNLIQVTAPSTTADIANNTYTMQMPAAGTMTDFYIQAPFDTSSAKVDKVTDWSYDVVMENKDDSSSYMKTTMVQGSIFAYFEMVNASSLNILRGKNLPATVVYDGGNVIVVRCMDNHDNDYDYYAFYGATGTTFNVTTADADTKISNIAVSFAGSGKYMTLAYLGSSKAVDDEFAKTRCNEYLAYAYNFVTDTKATYSYDEASSKVTTVYSYSFDKKSESTQDGTIMGVLPHQYKNIQSGTQFLEYTYPTIRGTMKTIGGSSFTTELKYSGILPYMPDYSNDANEDAILSGYLEDYTSGFAGDYFDNYEGSGDTYWDGKGLNRLSNAMVAAYTAGDTQTGDEMLEALKGRLIEWFTYTGTDDTEYFYYDETVGALFGFPQSYSSVDQINDHHFHYGYFIYAAAQVALRDAEFATQYGAMVNELIGDIACSTRNNADSRYPYLRSFAPYEGHSWASGHANFDMGNNQESSSEALNAWAGIILWGEAIGNDDIRDLGVYLYSTEVSAVDNYWYDVDEDVLSDAYRYKTPINAIDSIDKTTTKVELNSAAIVWGGSYTYATWFSANPLYIQGINLLPMNPTCFYLAGNADYIKQNYDLAYEKAAAAGWDLESWIDIWSQYYAMAYPEEALATWTAEEAEEGSYGVEGGDTKAHTYHFIKTLCTLGTPDTDITSNTTLSTAFVKDGKYSYVAYNTDDTEKTVTFSDGTQVKVPANSMKVQSEFYDDTTVVEKVPATGMTLDKEEATVETGSTVKIRATFAPANAKSETVTWKSSDDTIATVTNGTVTGIKEGTVTITATSESGFTDTCSVTVKKKVVVLGDKGAMKDAEGNIILFVKNQTSQTAMVAFRNFFNTESEAQAVTRIDERLGGYNMELVDDIWQLNLGKIADDKYLVYAFNNAVQETPAYIRVGDIPNADGEVTPDATEYTVTFDSNGGSAVTEQTVMEGEKATEPTEPTKDGHTFLGWYHGETKYDFNTAVTSDITLTAKWETTSVGDDDATVEVTGVTLDKTTLALKEGDTATLTATITPDDATDKTVTWSTSKSSVATVANGVVTAKAAGTATITVKTTNGKTATCEVTVTAKEVAVTGVTLNETTLALEEGDTATLTATVAPDDATDKSVTWSTSKSSVATVANGVVTAKAAGTATITAKTANGKTATCEVTVTAKEVAVTGVTLNTTSLALHVDDEVTLTATVAPTDATNQNVTWQTSDDSVATVVNGVVTAKATGEATITVTTEDGNKTATCSVTVTELEPDEVAVESITLDEETLELTEGDEATLTATVTPDNATDKAVTWNTSDDSVVTVINGVVTAVGAGEATILATTANGKSASCTVTVHAKVVEVTDVTLNETTLSLEEGKQTTLTATVTPDNATDKTITWETSDDSVATVTDGVVTALKAGNVTITAKAGNKTATCNVTVTAKTVAVTGVTLTKTGINLEVGGTETLTATVAPTEATNKNVIWESSEPTMVEVDANGKVKALKEGSAIVSVTTQDGSFTAICTVTVTKKADTETEDTATAVTGITMNKTALSLTEGGSETLTATVSPSTAVNKQVVWTTDNAGIAKVDFTTGMVTAVKAGTATITATTVDGGKTATCVVTVTAKAVVTPPVTTPAPEGSKTEAEAEKNVTETNTDKGDIAGSSFIKLRVKATGKNKQVKLSWKKVSGADGYIIYGAQCGKSLEKITTTTKKSYTQKGLKKGKYYKYVIAAYKVVDGKNYVIETSTSVHAATTGTKFGNPTKMTVKPAKATIKKGKKTTLKASYKASTKKVTTHIAKFRYESSNPEIATVNKKGVVKGVAKGKATIYVYTQNGICKTVKITVK